MSRPTHIQLVSEGEAGRIARATVPLATLVITTDACKVMAHLPTGGAMILHTAETPADARDWHMTMDEAINHCIAMATKYEWVLRWSELEVYMPTPTLDYHTGEVVAGEVVQ